MLLYFLKKMYFSKQLKVISMSLLDWSFLYSSFFFQIFHIKQQQQTD